MLGLICDFLIEVLCYQLGRSTIRLVTKGCYPKPGSLWDGLCYALGGLVILSALATLIISVAILQR